MAEIIDIYQKLPMPEIPENGVFDYQSSNDKYKDNTLEAVETLVKELFDFTKDDYDAFCDEFLKINKSNNSLILEQAHMLNTQRRLIEKIFLTVRELTPARTLGDTIFYELTEMTISAVNPIDPILKTLTFSCLGSLFTIHIEESTHHLYTWLKTGEKTCSVPVDDPHVARLVWGYVEWRYQALLLLGD